MIDRKTPDPTSRQASVRGLPMSRMQTLTRTSVDREQMPAGDRVVAEPCIDQLASSTLPRKRLRPKAQLPFSRVRASRQKPIRSSSPVRPEPARAHDVPGLWGYVDRINVAPGEAAILRVSSPAAYSVDLVRPRNAALLDPDAVATADRDDLDVLATFRHAIATPATISPGSYLS